MTATRTPFVPLGNDDARTPTTAAVQITSHNRAATSTVGSPLCARGVVAMSSTPRAATTATTATATSRWSDGRIGTRLTGELITVSIRSRSGSTPARVAGRLRSTHRYTRQRHGTLRQDPARG